MNDISTRLAGRDDSSAVVEMLYNLEAETGDAKRFEATAEVISKYGFGERSLFKSIIAARNGENIGLALYFPTFSTIKGLPGVYVQDLWLSKAARGLGLGRRLLAEAANRAGEEWGATYIMLTVYSDNQPAFGFYNALGFERSADEERMMLDATAFDALRSGS